ncbi:transposase [Streptomyces sp. NPDC058622]|uniref:transposase n=1 Tax=Streptomyces sp. NPDC058622 TaxID=3346562 RepID=UPI00364B647E
MLRKSVPRRGKAGRSSAAESVCPPGGGGAAGECSAARRPRRWIEAATADGLPALHGFVRGLEKDRAAVQAGLDLPYSNGTTEGVNNKTKLLKRQTYGRAGFALLRQRILLG